MIDFAWNVFINKVGYKTITINKEASMQIQFAYIIQQLLPLVSHAMKAISGVLRETGKLIVQISDDDLINMIESRGNGL
jgi:hypothetical protein